MVDTNRENSPFIQFGKEIDLSAESANKDALIICTKDRPEELRDTISALLEGCLEIPSLIVVVDSSDSGESKQELMGLASALDVRIMYINSKPGLPHQRNVGAYFVLEHFKSHSKYLFFLDDDVTPTRNYFSNARRIFEEFPEVGVLGGRDLSLALRGGNRLRAIFGFSRNAPRNISSGGFGSPVLSNERLVEALWVPGGMQTIRGELLLLEAFNGRIRMYGEDVDMHLRLGKHAKVVSSASLAVLHRSSEKGKDQPSDLFAYEDAFRWRLGMQYPKLVNPIMVIFTTLILIAITGFAGLKSTGKRAEFKGHLGFLMRLILGSAVEQYVSHDEWYVEPPKFG